MNRRFLQARLVLSQRGSRFPVFSIVISTMTRLTAVLVAALVVLTTHGTSTALTTSAPPDGRDTWINGSISGCSHKHHRPRSTAESHAVIGSSRLSYLRYSPVWSSRQTTRARSLDTARRLGTARHTAVVAASKRHTVVAKPRYSSTALFEPYEAVRHSTTIATAQMAAAMLADTPSTTSVSEGLITP